MPELLIPYDQAPELRNARAGDVLDVHLRVQVGDEGDEFDGAGRYCEIVGGRATNRNAAPADDMGRPKAPAAPAARATSEAPY